jgi:hypothetical protein
MFKVPQEIYIQYIYYARFCQCPFAPPNSIGLSLDVLRSFVFSTFSRRAHTNGATQPEAPPAQLMYCATSFVFYLQLTATISSPECTVRWLGFELFACFFRPMFEDAVRARTRI